MITAAAISAVLGMRKAGCLYVGVCPACGYPGAFTAEDRRGFTLVRCHACGDQTAVLAALRDRGLWSRLPKLRMPDYRPQTAPGTDSGHAARRIWEESRPAEGTPVEQYLRFRGIPRPVPPTIRFHPGLDHRPSGLRLPAMVSAVTVWPSSRVVAIHRTYLAPGGNGKAAVQPAKMTLGPIRGGAVRLAPHDGVLAVAEGIETALSVMAGTGLPAWSCLAAGGLVAVILPDAVREVIVAADHDANGVGQVAAGAAADRWVAEGRKVRIALPPVLGQDWNDALRENL